MDLFLFFVGFIALVVTVGLIVQFFQLRRAGRQMQELSRQLGGLEITWTGPLGPLFSFLKTPKVAREAAGRFRGRRVRVYPFHKSSGTGSNRTTTSRIGVEVSVDVPEDRKLWFSKSMPEMSEKMLGFASGVMKVVAGRDLLEQLRASRVELDDPALSEKIDLHCEGDDAARAFARSLFTPSIAGSLVRIMESQLWASVHLEERKFTYNVQADLHREQIGEHLLHMVGFLCDLAESAEDAEQRRRSSST